MKTINRDNEFRSSKLIMLLLIFSLMSFSSVTFSQDDQDQTAVAEDTDDTDNNNEDDEDVVELAPIVATGSRLLRETYESISPVQVITAQESRAVGQIDAADVLQSSTAASGQQIDLSFSGFVLDDGPGSQTISFRGLGAGRTLLMLNGRRVGPSGVEGVPAAPDLNLIPGALIQRYELLLDGSSSIYGSDAVAGVANAILRKDFNGWEVDYTTTVPEQSGGIENTVAVTWGKNFDRGFIGVGVQLLDNDSILFADREPTAGCSEHREIDQDGNILTEDLFFQRDRLMDVGSCKIGTTAGWLNFPGSLGGSTFYTPGSQTGGLANFSDWTDRGIAIDSNSDGIADVNLSDYSLLGSANGRTMRAELKSQNIMSYGEYTFEGENNITPFFEMLYSRRDTFQDSGQPQLFPVVPAGNPYNLCNPDGLNGVDCGLARNGLYENPGYIAAYIEANGCDPSADGDCPLAGNARGAINLQPVVSVDGDRDQTSTTVKQYRFLAGVKGDLPGLDWGQMSSWNFETYLSYHYSQGVASRAGIREDRLNYSLSTSRVDPVSGQVVCGNASASDGCVPINMFAGSLFAIPAGNFATQAERDYLFDIRRFDTKIKQTIFSGFLNGYVYELPAGPIAAGIGVELREDEIESIPDDIARDGLFFGFFSDSGAVGKKTTKEVFAEVEVPLLAGYKGAEELTFNISGRLTKDEFFPSQDTFSAKLGYRPIPSLLLKATIGTSYRAPNLRENFLLAQSGFGNVSDPCVTPTEAFDDPEDISSYVRGNDPRDQNILDNCSAQGIDPANFINEGGSFYNSEITRGGSTNVTEEQSDSLTYGFAWDVPFESDLDMTLGATYYEIDINNTIVESSSGSIIASCYLNSFPENQSTLCNRIIRNSDGLIVNVDAGFINRDNQTVRGVDVNLNLDKPFDVFGKPVDFGLDIVMTHTKEISELIVDTAANGTVTETFNDQAGEFGFPSWSGTVNLRASFDDFRITWQTRYIGNVEQGADEIDPFDDIDGIADTCIAPVLCRDVGFAEAYYNHTLSLYYNSNDWTIGFGISNLLNEQPPRVDNNEVFAIGNAPIGVGYDLNGRRYFLNIGKRF